MGRAKRHHSAGGHKLALKHGVSNKSQALAGCRRWLQENDRNLWLEDHGMNVVGVYKAGHIHVHA
eukprot:1156014-Pelagomonas_calceolata.AAC.2